MSLLYVRQQRNDRLVFVHTSNESGTFSEKISALTGSGKEISVKRRWHENREIVYERILAWTTEGAYEVFRNM